MSAAQERVQAYVKQLDGELSKYPVLNSLEKQTSIPKTYGVIGLAALYFFFIIFNLGGQLLTNVAGFIIPGYYSLDALFSVSKTDDTQWLTYWVVFAFLTVIESAISIVYWFPFYYTFKFLFLLWLSLPGFHGAELIFHSFMAPTLGRYFHRRPASASSSTTAESLRARAEASFKSE